MNKQEDEIPRVNSKDTFCDGENTGPITPAANHAAATVVQNSESDLFCPMLIILIKSRKHYCVKFFY